MMSFKKEIFIKEKQYGINENCDVSQTLNYLTQ